MTDDNVVILGQDKKEEEQNPAENNKVILQLLDKRRKEGMERLDKVAKELEDMRHRCTDNEMELRLRAIETGVKSACTTLEGTNGVLDVFIQDFMNLVMATDRNFQSALYQGLHVQTIIEMLVEKGLMTEAELEAKWEKTLKDNGLENAKEQAESTDPSPSPQ